MPLFHPGPRLSFGIAGVGVAGLGTGVGGCEEVTFGSLSSQLCGDQPVAPGGLEFSSAPGAARVPARAGPSWQMPSPAQEPPRELVAVAAPAPGSRGGLSLRFSSESPCAQPRTISAVRVQTRRNQGKPPAFHRPPAAKSQHRSLYTWVPERGINLHADRLLGRVLKKNVVTLLANIFKQDSLSWICSQVRTCRRPAASPSAVMVDDMSTGQVLFI